MTTKPEQAARQALEALREYRDTQMISAPRKAIEALREALAEQAEQEPVARKSVPIEPTEDMLLAAELSQPRGYRELYAAMINAAPVQQAEQKPVAAYKDAPRVIYLQTGCEDPEFCECSFNEWGDTTWCADKIHDTDIPYIREDYTVPVRTKDLTDDEIWKELVEIQASSLKRSWLTFARAVIAADRENNK